MQVCKTEILEIRTENDVVRVRKTVREWTLECRFGIVDQTKFVTASSELARNTLIYGRGGTVRLERLSHDGRNGVRLVFEDQGPGIPDVDLALSDGYTTGGGMGMGLGGAKRLSNEFELTTRVGEGTTIAITRWKL